MAKHYEQTNHDVISGYMAFKFIKMDIDRFRKDIDRFLNALEYRDMAIKKSLKLP